ncbi:putative F-box protein [Cardamine amara subsp. amara]|uniref:F-box protein n=1 Tax=Cardamine amara subsp. amara TaxID=228776 RepID=A0ABD1B7L4_CARAN
METQRMKRTKEIMNSNTVSHDLMIEIFKRLPVKTLIRFLCLSKLWASTIRSRYFKKLFVNESLTRPKSLVFIFRRRTLCAVPFSSVCLKSTREASSSSASSPTYHVTCHTRQRTTIAPSVHGLICNGPASRLVIYNPCTRGSITLPKINAGRRSINQYIGYDPIENDYKVLCITKKMRNLTNKRGLAEEIRVLTLGSTQDSWRMIQDIIPPHSPESEELCINGVLYYQAFTGTTLNDSAIMSFDVRSEKLQLIKGPCNFPSFSKLTNYEGKIAVIFFIKKVAGIIGLWVLKDPSKEHWLKKAFVLPDFNMQFRMRQILRTTNPDTGEIIFTPNSVHTSLPGAVYFDLRKNTVRKFEIQGTTEQYVPCDPDLVSSSLVDNLMFL